MMIEEDDDRPSPPKGWECPTLNELADQERGITYGIVQPGQHVTDGVPIVRVQNIVDGTLETSDVMRVAPEIAAKYRRTRLRGGELLLSLVGSVGSSVIAPPEVAGWNTARAVAVVPLRAGIDPRWVRFCLRSAPLQHLMESWCNTTVQATLNLKDVWRLPIPLPPKREREAIVAVLGALDEKIELNRRMNRALEELAAALFRSWFVDFDPVVAKAAGRAPFGLAPEVAVLFPATFTDSELGPIPHGWRVGTIGDIADNPRRQITPSEVAPDMPYIGLEHMPRKSICLMDAGTAADVSSGKSRFAKGEILFGKLRPYFHKVGIAPCAGVCSTDVLVVTPRAEPWFGVLLGHLSSEEFIDYADGASGGTRMPRTSWHDMKRYCIALPPEPLAQKLTEHYRGAATMFAHHREGSRTLAALRDTLLPKLLSGELRVKAADSTGSTASTSSPQASSPQASSRHLTNNLTHT